jgi:Flp pilus assembly pilin Flp
MKNYILNLIRGEQGQDLIEYTLLLAFVVLASAALFISAGGSIETIWGYSSTTLGCAASAANPS